jgi:hypothetical protein
VRVLVSLAVAAASIVGAQLVREAARSVRDADKAEQAPYTPTAQMAPFVSLGYRELAADLLYARFRGYFGGGQSSSDAMGDLAEAIVAVDPQFRRAYDLGAIAMTAAAHGVTNESYLRAIRLLAAGSRVFPDNWRLPHLAGQIYLVDLQTTDPAQRREWDNKGALLLETAARKPGAPADAALTAVFMQTKLGQQEYAIRSLRELLLITDDERARQRILEKLAALTEDNQDEIASELLAARKRFDQDRRKQRPAIPPSMFVLLGPPLPDSFDMADLATGGRDLSGAAAIERLEPLE